MPAFSRGLLFARLLLLPVLAAASSSSAPAAPWAFLVAGSKTWENYRHQADVAHAYQTLVSRGVPPAQIVTFMYDDLAQNPENPFPGSIFNVATGSKKGTDLYKGLKIDYSLGNVTASNVISALLCDGKVSGPCLRSTAGSEVFVYWAGHGDDQDGLIMPDGGAHGALGSDTLVSALESLHRKGAYKSLVFFLEACDGGSMFAAANARLEAINVLAVTAAKPGEPSYPLYCCDFFKPPSCTVAGKDIGTCLGDMFSLAWLTDSDRQRKGETLGDQAKLAKANTAPAGGNPGSTVMTYGALSLLKQAVSNFEGGGGGSIISSRVVGGGGGGGEEEEQEEEQPSFSESLSRFLAAGRVTPTTPWVVDYEQKRREKQVSEHKTRLQAQPSSSTSSTSSTNSPSPPSPVMDLVLLSDAASKDGAVCLDGSPPAYYWRPSSSSSSSAWILFLEGGGWCAGLDDAVGGFDSCASRSLRGLGSSKSYQKVMTPGYEGGTLLSTDPKINPRFHDWNVAYAKYCDGASFSGNRSEAVPIANGTRSLHFRGARILKAIVDNITAPASLGGKGMHSAKEALLSGCSAGGLAVYHHCDEFSMLLSPLGTAAKCVADAGYFANLPSLFGKPPPSSGAATIIEYEYTWSFENQHVNMSTLGSPCRKALGNSDARCFFPEFNLRHTTTPLFALQSGYDSWQTNFIWFTPNGGKPT